MKKRIISVFIVLVVFLSIAVPVLADAFTAKILTTESNGTDYDMLAIICDSPNEWLVDNEYMDATGLDTRVGAYPHMVADDKVIFARPLPAYENGSTAFISGQSLLDSFPIVLGYDGYITVADNPILEPGNDFSFIISNVYTNTLETATYTAMISKDNAFMLLVTAIEEISAVIFNAPTTITENGSSADLTLDNVNKRAGQRVNALPPCIITNIGFWLTKIAGPTGTGYFRLRDVATDELIGTIGTIDVSTIGAVSSLYQRSNYPFYYAGGDARFTFEYEDGTAVNSVDVRYINGGVTTDNFCYYSAGVWTDLGAVFDARGTWSYAAPAVMVTHDCDEGEHDITVSADTVNLSLSVDGDATTAALGGSSIINVGDDWRIFSKRLVYADTISYYVASDLKYEYEPVSIIEGNTMPNSINPGTYDGTITWGTNPAGVTAELYSFQPYAESKASISTLLATPEWHDEPTIPGDFTTEPASTFPGASIIKDISDDLGEPSQLPIFIISCFVILALSISMSNLMARLGTRTIFLKAGIIFAAMAIMMAAHTYDFWMMLFFGIMVIAIGFASRREIA